MKKPQLLILMLFVTLIMVCMYSDNPNFYQDRLYKSMHKCRKQLGCWQEMIHDKMPF